MKICLIKIISQITLRKGVLNYLQQFCIKLKQKSDFCRTSLEVKKLFWSIKKTGAQYNLRIAKAIRVDGSTKLEEEDG